MSILEFDRDHLWHPYTSMNDPLPCYEVVSAEGVRLRLADSRELIDGMSSWWATVHGYNHPVLNRAITDQLSRMSHVMFGGITHRPAVELGQKILKLVPHGLEHIFYADSGSVAVEVAMKMAMQYCHCQGQTRKKKFITIRSGYHGDTWNAMSVCDPDGGMHSIWNGALAEHIFVETFERQYREESFEPMRKAIQQNHEITAAVILEPMVQGAGGMRFYDAQYLVELKRTCDHYGVLLIFDEIATGFGRTGKMFAAQWADVTPDIMCIGKALTGGYMTLAAAVATSKVAHGIQGSFMHGPTFMANPLACAVANASLGMLIENSPVERITQIERLLLEGLAPARKSPRVADVRVMGAIGVVELCEAVDMSSIQADFVDHGVWIRPFGRLVYTMPPYVINDQDLRKLTSAIVDVVCNLESLDNTK